MRILITGATGFVGSNLVSELLSRNHSVIAVARDISRARKLPWFDFVTFINCDIHENFNKILNYEPIPDVVVHLAWPGLPNFKDIFHISENLPADLKFLSAIIKSGVRHISVAGTCLEYGILNGPLTEEMKTYPSTPYGFAKDILRKSLQFFQKEIPFTLQWMRLFYLYGEGQNKNSLLPLLDKAIENKELSFNMSSGRQLRDYLHINTLAEYYSAVLENPECNGIINCCSGIPISVYELVIKRCQEKSSNIKINRDYFPMPDYEPLKYWGVPSKLRSLGIKE